MSRTLASRFPSVSRLLGIAAAEDEQRREDEGNGQGGEDDDQDGGGEGEGEGEGQGGEGEGGSGGEGEGQGGGEGEGQGGEQGGEGAGASIGSLNANDRMRLMGGFEADAAALVAAERERCINVFTSPVGRTNPEGAASVLRDSDMAADRAIAFMGTFSGGSSRSAARQRLNSAPETRVNTGGSEESTAQATGVKANIAKTREARNKATKARGGVPVGRDTK